MARTKVSQPANQPQTDSGSEPIWNGNPVLRPFLVPLSALREDPDNANRHPDRSLEEIAASYVRFGQQKPIVIGTNGLVKDGNGQLVAATGLGWTHLAVFRSDLTKPELAAYALTVNKIPESSEWDFVTLAKQLQELSSSGTSVVDIGWNPGELNALLAVAAEVDSGSRRINLDVQDGVPSSKPIREYDESVADSVKFYECPECHHRWPV